VTQDVSSIPAQLVDDDRSPESASCVVPDEQVWHTSQPANVDLDALDQAFLHRSSETEPLHDMVSWHFFCGHLTILTFDHQLCNIQSTVVASNEDDESKGFAERDNVCLSFIVASRHIFQASDHTRFLLPQDALREYFSVRTNIVLCSSYPEVAPHIVISPAIDTPEDFYIPWMNRVHYYGQEPHRLPVPGFDASRLARMPYRDEQCYWPVTMGYRVSMACGNPRRVFSRSRFDQLVCYLSQPVSKPQKLYAPADWLSQTVETGSERLTMYHVVTALQRHRFKAVVSSSSRNPPLFYPY
jgi:hypothetical protein